MVDFRINFQQKSGKSGQEGRRMIAKIWLNGKFQVSSLDFNSILTIPVGLTNNLR